MPHQETTTLNIPSILAFALLSFFAIRYFFFTPRAQTNARAARRSNQIPYDRIESLASAFPQADRRKIEWDLLRNGGNTQATAHRILAGTLAEPPPSFRAQTPPTPISSGSSTGARRADAPKFENLIQRYKLDQRVAEEEKRRQEEGAAREQAEAAAQGKGEWSAKREDRQAALKKRREDMVLEARRKMEERMKKEGGAGGTSTATAS